LFLMNKGSFKQFLRGNTAHRFPKIVTLAVTSSVLVAMIAVDASASSNGQGSTGQGSTASNSAYVTTTLTLGWSQPQLRELASHWQPRHSAFPLKPVKLRTITTVTTTTPPVTTTTPAPTVPTLPPTTSTTTPATTTTTAPPTTTTTSPAPTTTTSPAPITAFPTGTADSSEPSGYAPSSSSALAGYSQSYVNDFTGTTLPSGWEPYSGTPSGDPGGQFGSAHDIVGGGILSLNTFQDPAYNNEWVTGGLCQCGHSQTYGAYFVRSRLTGAGPTGVELLWPATNAWPPEIDFNETLGGTSSTTATVHYNTNNSQVHNHTNVDMTQWHTWGVIWTPASVTYTVDGSVWATVTNTASIPNLPMTLDLQQQTWCSSGYACPTAPQSMQVDWVAEYSAT